MEPVTIENEAKVLFDMYKHMNNLISGEYESLSAVKSGPVKLTITEKSVHLKYEDGTESFYQEVP